MIPTREQLDSLAICSEGSLEAHPFAVVLCALALHERTAILEIRRRQLEKRIVFENGIPVDCSSNLVHETLGRFLISQGKLEESQFRECLGAAAERGLRLGELLVERELLTPYELFRMLQQNLAKKLLDGFSWQDGEFRILTGATEVESPLKVKVPQLVVTGICRFAPQTQINSSVGAWVGQRLAMHPEPFFPLDEIRLSKSQSKILEALDGPRRIDELAQGTGVSFDELTRFLYALSVVRGVAPESEIPKVARPSKPVEKATEPIAIGTPTAKMSILDPAAVASVRNEVMQAYLNYRSQDAFDLLGLESESFTVAKLESRFLDHAERFGPARFKESGFEAMAEKGRDLLLAGARAFGELSDPEKRDSLIYRRQSRLKDAGQKKGGYSSIKTDLLDSEMQFKKGKEFVAAGKLHDAVQVLEFASDCDPQNATYRAELAFARFLLEPNTAGDSALESLKEALRIDPSCGEAIFYMGDLLRRLGRLDEAEPFLRRACKVMTDRRPTEALKELVLARKKKGWRS